MLKNNKALVGVVWSVSGAASQTIFQLLVFVMLARTLTPEVFGVVAIASAMIDILNLVGRGGLVEVIVNREEVSERNLNNGFFASLIIGAALTAALFVTAPYLADIFDTSQLKNVVQLLAPVCVIYAIGAVYEAKLRRDYHFKQLALRNTTATIVSGLVALAMALEGFGVYALVAQRLISTLWALAAMVLASRWLPTLDIDRRDMGYQLKQGFSIALSSILGTGNQRLIDLIVGYFLGPTQLGYLRIAWRVLDLIMEIAVRPISNVMLTMLATTRKNGGDVAAEYISLIRYSSAFILPIFLGFSTISTQIVTIMFGLKWVRSAELLSVLSLSGIFIPLIYFKSNILIASGRFRHVLYLNSIEFLLSVVIVSIFAPFGLLSATVGNVVRTAIATPVILIYLQWLLGVSAVSSVRAALPSIVSAGGMVLAVYAAKQALPPSMPSYLSLIVYIGIGAIVFAMLILATDRRLMSDIRAKRQGIA